MNPLCPILSYFKRAGHEVEQLLASPCTTAQLKALEEAIAQPVPVDLKALLSLYDGMSSHGEGFALLPGFELFGVTLMARKHKELDEILREGDGSLPLEGSEQTGIRRGAFVPFAGGPSGDYMVVRQSEPTVNDVCILRFAEGVRVLGVSIEEVAKIAVGEAENGLLELDEELGLQPLDLRSRFS